MITSGCAINPWERDLLALPSMQFKSDDLSLIMEDHFYFSKEGMNGGRGFSGGGCGCN